MVAEKASLGTKDHRDHQKPISSDISTSKDPAQNRNSKKYQIPGCTLEHVLSPKQRLPWYSTLSSTRCATLGVSRCIALVERSMMLAVFTAQLRQVSITLGPHHATHLLLMAFCPCLPYTVVQEVCACVPAVTAVHEAWLSTQSRLQTSCCTVLTFQCCDLNTCLPHYWAFVDAVAAAGLSNRGCSHSIALCIGRSSWWHRSSWCKHTGREAVEPQLHRTVAGSHSCSVLWQGATVAGCCGQADA